MTFHTVAFFESLATGVMTQISPVQDNVIIIQNDRFLPSVDYDLIYAAAMSQDINRFRIENPQIRSITLPIIRPQIDNAVPVDNSGVADYSDFPFKVKGVEELGVQAFSDAAVGPENTTALLGLRRSFRPTQQGQIFTMRGTGATALVANTWTTSPITFDDNLPAGVYAVVGLMGVSATLQAVRLILNEQVERPGALAVPDIGFQGNSLFRKGRLGEWGRFNTIALPQVQFLANAADATQTVFIDIMRVG